VNLEVGSTPFVVGPLIVFGMLPTIDFDRQSTLRTEEIEEVRAHAVLTNELQTIYVPTA